MKLRPHHLLCTQGYSGRGYSDAFVKNLNAITAYLRDDNNATITLVRCTDDICRACPHKLGDNVCTNNEKVQRMDDLVISYFGLQLRTYRYQDIIRQINHSITPSMLNHICGACQWYPISACRKNILGE
ncbi:MAG: DUF1284 domain-containing protein [Oscillospiraceae bacterium]|nr:DUF1284 domain-containing protein [Oscillospiraceae bacterium]